MSKLKGFVRSRFDPTNTKTMKVVKAQRSGRVPQERLTAPSNLSRLLTKKILNDQAWRPRWPPDFSAFLPATPKGR